MSKPIVCLDFDGVVHSYVSGWKGGRHIPDPPVAGALPYMVTLLTAGYDVVIHSSRARSWGGIRAMRTWLREWSKHSTHGAPWYDDPAGPGLESVRFMRWKPSAQITIDDRALTFTGVWPSVDMLRAFQPWHKKNVKWERIGYVTTRLGPSGVELVLGER